jgi:multiple sugar transport system permease protein
LPYNELLRPLALSLVVSSAVVVLQLVTALPAAYALRSGVRLLPLYLLLLSVPAELLLIPLYSLLKDLKLLNNPLALVVPFIANPFIVFLLYSGIAKLPWTFVEAAKLDGATNLQILTRVIAPLLRPEMIAAGVLGFAAHWNLVLYPKVMLDNPAWWTVQVALTDMLRKDPNAWGKLGAAAMITSLPILVLYLFFESRVTKTLEGGLK